jgi:hypothetical protein
MRVISTITDLTVVRRGDGRHGRDGHVDRRKRGLHRGCDDRHRRLVVEHGDRRLAARGAGLAVHRRGAVRQQLLRRRRLLRLGVQCWGNNDYGALGDNSTLPSWVPVAVTGLSSGIAAIASGAEHTCALTTVGGVQCWGGNYWGQLGNNSTTDGLVPVAVVEP